jgi:hypothetical protein
MSSKGDKACARWHPDQEKIFLDILSIPRFKPVGGDADGTMGRKVELIWEPLLHRFMEENGQLSGSNHATSTGLGMKCDFSAKALQQKYALMSSKYKDLKRCCKVGRHELRGETGSAAEGQASTVQEVIGSAAKSGLCLRHGTQLLVKCSG